MERGDEEEMTTIADHRSGNTLREEGETEHITPGISLNSSPEVSRKKDDSSEYVKVHVRACSY